LFCTNIKLNFFELKGIQCNPHLDFQNLKANGHTTYLVINIVKIVMSDLFDVTLDQLIKGNIELKTQTISYSLRFYKYYKLN
jgi:hypothetical protein